MLEFDGVGEYGVSSVRFEPVESLVVLECRPNVESVLAAEVPKSACCWLGMEDCATAIGWGGAAEKSKHPLKYSQAERVGVIVAWRRRLRASSAWEMRRSSHCDLGKAGLTDTRIARKVVRIARSAAFCWCMLGGTRW